MMWFPCMVINNLLKINIPFCKVVLPLAFTTLNTVTSSSVNFCFNGCVNRILYSSLKCFLISLTFYTKIISKFALIDESVANWESKSSMDLYHFNELYRFRFYSYSRWFFHIPNLIWSVSNSFTNNQISNSTKTTFIFYFIL